MRVGWYVLGGSVAMIALIVMLFGVRGMHSDRPPIQVFPDMKLQPKYHAQGENRFFADRRDMRIPPAGTVPYGGRDHSPDAGNPLQDLDLLQEDDLYFTGLTESKAKLSALAAAGPGGAFFSREGAKVFVDRIPARQGSPTDPRWEKLDETRLMRGREVFNYTCAICHGLAGNGKGVTRQYGMQPANLHDAAIVPQPDGRIYETLTKGRGSMKGYGHMVRPADRWAVVAYVRALQRSQAAKADDIPADWRRELGLQP